MCKDNSQFVVGTDVSGSHRLQGLDFQPAGKPEEHSVFSTPHTPPAVTTFCGPCAACASQGKPGSASPPCPGVAAAGCTCGGGLVPRARCSQPEMVGERAHTKTSSGIKGLFKKLSRLAPGRRRTELSADESVPGRRIVVTRDFSRLYELGEELIESSRTGTEVRHAKRRKDGMPVVVKVRRKGRFGEDGCAFASVTDETEWRRATEVVLNLARHAQIVYIHEVLEDASAYYVVMEKAQGSDLFETSRKVRGPTLGLRDVQEILRQVLEAVRSLHDQGCVHRDIKLDNVVLDRSRRPRDPQSPERSDGPGLSAKIVDFDDAQMWPMSRCESSCGSRRCVVGTDQYIAPEAYSGEWSPASDIFAVGVMLFRLLNGRFPFDPRMFDDGPGENYVGSPKMEDIRRRLEKSIVDFHRRARGAPSEDSQAISLCRRMLSMDPDGRPSASEALADPWFAKQRSSSSSTASVAAPPACAATPPPVTPALLSIQASPRKPEEAVEGTEGKALAESMMYSLAMQMADEDDSFDQEVSAPLLLPGCVLEDDAVDRLAAQRPSAGSHSSGGTSVVSAVGDRQALEASVWPPKLTYSPRERTETLSTRSEGTCAPGSLSRDSSRES